MRCAFTVPGTTHALLTFPSAMQCWSWSIPAGPLKYGGSCAPFFTNPDDPHRSVCGHCYALQARYTTTAVRNAQNARFAWTRTSLATHEGTTDWLSTMHVAIHAVTGKGYFRVHDSGDFFNAPYISAWTTLCHTLRHTHFWFPTRAWRLPYWLDNLRALHALPNVNVTPCALSINDPPPAVGGLGLGLTVTNSPHTITALQAWKIPDAPVICPKSLYHTNCATENCRHCWSKEGSPVAYLLHGRALTAAGLRRHTPLTLEGSPT